MPLMKRKELAVTNSEMTMIDQRAPVLGRPVVPGSLNIRPRSRWQPVIGLPSVDTPGTFLGISRGVLTTVEPVVLLIAPEGIDL